MFAKFANHSKKRFSYERLSSFERLPVDKVQLMRCFVDSKMFSSMPNNSIDRIRWYKELDYTEFIVFLCRVSEFLVTPNTTMLQNLASVI